MILKYVSLIVKDIISNKEKEKEKLNNELYNYFYKSYQLMGHRMAIDSNPYIIGDCLMWFKSKHDPFLHRLDGPAVKFISGKNDRWFIEGERINYVSDLLKLFKIE